MVFKVEEATHLFWGEYPYKALVELPIRLKDFKSSGPYFLACRQSAKTLVFDTTDYKQRVESNKVSLFFKTKSSFDFFIKNNEPLISKVTAPASDIAMKAMQDRKIRVRPSLFFRKFRWKITMTAAYRLVEEANEPIDSWVEDYFDITRPAPKKNIFGRINSRCVSNDRIHYNYNNARIIYVSSVSDAVAVKIGLSDYIADIEECLLVSELPTNISDSE